MVIKISGVVKRIWTEDIFKKQNEYFLDIGFTVWLNEFILQRMYSIPNNYNDASGLGNTEEYME